jgi:hypothetical protein
VLDAAAQITIRSTDFPAVGSQFTTYSAAAVTNSLGSAGPNQTWDWTSYDFSEGGPTELVSPASTGYAASFPTATLAYSIASDPVSGYAYGQNTGSALNSLGYAGMADGQQMTVVFNPAAQMLPFPLTYQSSWSTVIRFSRQVAGHTVSYVDSTLCVADAWGTVRTPNGDFPCLRIQEHTYSKVIISPLPPTITEDYSYSFLLNDGFCGADVTNAEGTGTPNFTLANISATLSAAAGIGRTPAPVIHSLVVGQNYPNPFNSNTILPLELTAPGRVDILIFDATGRMVGTESRELTSGICRMPINGSQWTSGTYFARVRRGAENSTVKMQLIK